MAAAKRALRNAKGIAGNKWRFAAFSGDEGVFKIYVAARADADF